MSLDTVNDLLEAIEQLPPLERHRTRVRVSAAMNRSAREARAVLGLIALDLAQPEPSTRIDLTDAVSA
jgi:hypothetical protein